MKVTAESIAIGSGVDTDYLVAQILPVAVTRGSVYDPSRGRELDWLYGMATCRLRGHRRAESRRLAGCARAAEPDVVGEFADRVDHRIDAVATHRRVAPAIHGCRAPV